MNYQIRKVSILKKDPLGDDTWVHYPHRSDLTLSFIKLNRHYYKVKVLWRATELEELEFAVISEASPKLTLTARFPYIAFKWVNDSLVKRFQVGFHNIKEHESCLKYTHDLGLKVHSTLHRSSILSEKDPRYSLTHCNSQNQLISSQLSNSQVTNSQYSAFYQAQDYQPTGSRRNTISIYREEPSFAETWNESDLSLRSPNTTQISQSTPSLPNSFLQLKDLASMCDEDIVLETIKLLENPRFQALCDRLDKITQESKKTAKKF